MPEDDVKPEQVHEEAKTADDDEVVDPADELNDLAKDVEQAAKPGDGETATGAEKEGVSAEGKIDEPPADQFDPEILQLAGAMGKSEQWARSRGSVQQLERDLLLLGEARQEVKAAQEAPEGKPPDVVVPKIEPGEDVDDAMAKKMNAALAELHTQLTTKFDETTKAHTERMDRAERAVQQQHRAMFIRSFDEMAKSNSNGYSDLIGEGKTMGYRAGSKERLNREKVMEEMHVIVAGKQMRGQPIPDDAELYRQALRAAHGDRSAQAAREELDGELGARKKAMIRRPGGKTQPVSKKAQAQLALREKLIALNAGVGEESGEF